MARILTPEQFRQCPKGTVFAHGPKWSFGDLKILDEIIPLNKDGQWGFWSACPMYPDVADSRDADPLMEESLRTGRRFDCDLNSTKSMNYHFGEHGRDFAVFIVLDREDWARINSMVSFPDDAAWPADPPADLKDRLEEALYDRNNPASPADAYDIFKAWCSENGIKAPTMGQVADNVA